MQAFASAVQDSGPAADYSRFHAAVARAQLTAWLAELAPTGQRFLVDISGPGARAAEVAACAGHTVLRVVEPGTPTRPLAGYDALGQVRAVAADGFGLEFLPNGCADRKSVV